MDKSSDDATWRNHPLIWNKVSAAFLYLVAFFLAASLFFMTRRAYMTSDNAWYAIAGRGIAEGNILLRNWVANTISQYFPYSLVEAVWALVVPDYRTGHALTIVTLTALLFFLVWIIVCKFSEKRLAGAAVLSTASIFVAMPTSMMTDGYAHLAPLMTTLLLAYLLYFTKFGTREKIVTLVMLALWCDNYNYAYFLLPLAVENIMFRVKTGKFDTRILYVVIGMACHFIFLFLLQYMTDNYTITIPGEEDKLFSVFVPFDRLEEKVTGSFFALSDLYSANFWGMEIKCAIPQGVFACVMFCAMYLIFSTGRSAIFHYQAESAKKRFLAFLLLSTFLVYSVVTFSAVRAYVQRWYTGPYINTLILFSIFIATRVKVKTAGVLALIFLVLSAHYQVEQKRYKTDPALKERHGVVRRIHDEGLHRGFAWFGNALNTNFIANAQIIATLEPKSFRYYYWMVDERIFYGDKFDFVLSWKEGKGEWGYHDPSDEEIRAHFGQPAKIIDEGRVRIYVYDQDISGKVEKPLLIDPKYPAIRKWRACDLPIANARVDKETCAVTSLANSQGLVTYGPYIRLPQGNYSFEIEYTGVSSTLPTDIGDWNIVAQEVLEKGVFQTTSGNRGMLRGTFTLPPRYIKDPIEIRTFVRPDAQLTIHDIEIKRID